MSMLFNIFPDSGSEEDYDIEDGKTQIPVLEGNWNEDEFVTPESVGQFEPGHLWPSGGQHGAWIMNTWPYANRVVLE